MLSNSIYIKRIEKVAKGLGDLSAEVVFIGGAVVSLYIEDEAVQEIRPTKDIDCIIELAGRIDYYKLEEKLRDRGFKHSVSKDSPVCRWDFEGIMVDVMPTDEKILGFSNKWYKKGIKNCEQLILPERTVINIFQVGYFIASKIEAFKNRSNKDYRYSHDIEDIITVLDGLKSFDSLIYVPEDLKGYLQKEFDNFISDSRFIEAIAGHIENIQTRDKRAERIIVFFERY